MTLERPDRKDGYGQDDDEWYDAEDGELHDSSLAPLDATLRDEDNIASIIQDLAAREDYVGAAAMQAYERFPET